MANLDPALLDALRAGGDGRRGRRGRVPRQQRLALRGVPGPAARRGGRRSTARARRPPGGSPRRTRLRTCPATRSTSGRPTPRRGCPSTAPAYGLCQIYGNEPWHFELRPEAVEQGCPPCTPTRRRTRGCSGEWTGVWNAMPLGCPRQQVSVGRREYLAQMEYGAHLPQIDFDGAGLASDARRTPRRRAWASARSSANDHLVFQRPWLDGIVALASVVEASGDLTLATTVALPVVRGPAALAKAAAALDLLSGGRLVLGVGPGSSRARLRRWPGCPSRSGGRGSRRRSACCARTCGASRRQRDAGARAATAPARRSADLGRQLGVGGRACAASPGWATAGSPRRTTRHPSRSPPARAARRAARPAASASCSLATMWTYVTDDAPTSAAHQLAGWRAMLRRPEDELAGRVLVGPAEQCATLAARLRRRGRRPALRLAAGRAGAPARTVHARRGAAASATQRAA